MTIISIIGNLIIFALFIAFLKFVYKHSTTTHPEIFELMEGEEIIENVKCDYWEKLFLFQYAQRRGEIAFTNKRIIFKGTYLLSAFADISIPYSEIISVEKTNVAIFFPIAFKVTTMTNEKYKFAIMKRKHFIDLINQLAHQSDN